MKTPATPKHRAIIHLAADMRKGAGAHSVDRKPGPSADEWEKEPCNGHTEFVIDCMACRDNKNLERIWSDHDEAMAAMAIELMKDS